MKPQEFLNIMATMADAEARSTATLVEVLTAVVLMKLHPPARGDDVVSVTVSEADMATVLRDFHFEARYVDGEMTIFLTPLGSSRESSLQDS